MVPSPWRLTREYSAWPACCLWLLLGVDLVRESVMSSTTPAGTRIEPEGPGCSSSSPSVSRRQSAKGLKKPSVWFGFAGFDGARYFRFAEIAHEGPVRILGGICPRAHEPYRCMQAGSPERLPGPSLAESRGHPQGTAGLFLWIWCAPGASATVTPAILTRRGRPNDRTDRRPRSTRRAAMTIRRSTKTDLIRTALIAPCGMNCRLCIAYNRDKNACSGCRGDDSVKSKTRVMCRIKTCEKMVQGRIRYCFGCDSYPCATLNHLDKRYRTKYGMSMIDNLENIRKFGIRNFIRNEDARWKCPKCGERICVHKPRCLFCEYAWR